MTDSRWDHAASGFFADGILPRPVGRYTEVVICREKRAALSRRLATVLAGDGGSPPAGSAGQSFPFGRSDWSAWAAGFQEGSAGSPGTVFWRDILEIAQVHRLVLPLGIRLRDSGFPVPPQVQQEFEQALLVWRAKRRAFTEVLQLIGELAATEKIPLILMKGLSLADRLYPNPESRIFADLDLLARAEDFSRLVKKLGQAGFRETEGPYYGLPAAAISAWELPLSFSPNDAPGLHIDLHSNLTHRLEAYRLPAAPVWERAVPWRFGLMSLSDEDLLLFLMIHSLKHGHFHLQAFLDLHFAARDSGFRKVFPAVLGRAAAAGFGTLVRTVAELGRRLYGTQWPGCGEPGWRVRTAAKLLEPRICDGQPVGSERFQLLLTAGLVVDSLPRLLQYWWLCAVRPPATIPAQPYRSSHWANPWAGLVRQVRKLKT